MKAKRILSALLTLLMLTTVLACLPLGSTAAEPVRVTATNPLLTADVGETVSLSDVKVDGLTGSVTWKQDGNTVASCTPAKKGVTVLTASDGTHSRNIYLVAKEANETEYVLYENDFSGTLDALKTEGWSFPDGKATVSDGQLHIGAKADYAARAYLPAWLGDFGDYQITARASQTNISDNSRWCSVIYRAEGIASSYQGKPFYHMCVRANTTNSTLEFAELLANGNWNVIAPNSISNLNMTSSLHTLTVRAYETVVEYLIDGRSEFYTSAATAHDKGVVGLFSNQGVMNLDSIRVTALTSKPAEPVVEPKLINTAPNRTDSGVSNYVSNHAYVTKESFSELSAASSYPVAVLFDLKTDATAKADFVTYLTFCASNNIIPEFKLGTKAQVDALAEALDTTRALEALVASEDAEIVKYARSKKKTLIRGALDVTNLTKEKLSDSELFELYAKAAGAYAQAIILPYHLATKSNVALLQEYELAVWAFGKNVDTDTKAAWLLTSGANAVISDNWSKLASVQTSLFTETNALTRTPVWTAHRGYSSAYPENGMNAFRAAFEAGADFVECDVHLSRDNVVMVCHDDTINRTTNGMGSISNMTCEAIRQYKLRKPNGTLSDETVPTFEELLLLVKGKKDRKILCEFKSYNLKLAQETAKLIKKHGMENQVVFISFAAAQLEQIKKELPTSTGLLLSAPTYVDASNIVKTLNNYAGHQNNCLSYSSTIATNYGNITAEFLRDAQDRGMTLFSWTYAAASRAKVCEMFLSGMNGMTTNDPQELQNAAKTLLAPKTFYVKPNGSGKLTIRSETYKGTVTDVTANAKFKVLDNDGVIEITADGTVKAKKEGTATLIACCASKLPNNTAYTLYTQPITVRVTELDRLTILDDSDLTVDQNNRLIGMTEKTALSALLAQIADSESVVVTDAKGKTVTGENALIGNGYVLTYKNSKATVLLHGDLDGNGKVDALDYIKVRRAFFGLVQLDELQTLAGDVTGSGSVNAQDCIKIRRHVMGLINIFA